MKTKYTKKQISEAISHWKKVLETMGPLEEVGADDVLNMWKSKQDAEAKNSPAADSKSATPTQEVKPKKFTSYAMGNNTHELYAGDWIFGMYMQKDQKYAYYAIYRMSKLNAPKFKSLKNKSQTSTLKMFLTREAELIEKDEHGDWTLDKFIDEMKRLVGPSHFNRQPVLFTAGLKKTIYHYDRNPAHRGKTTMTTQTTGHITYDLNDIKFDAADIDVHSGRSKQHQLAYGGSSSKLPRQQKDHSYEEIKEAIAHWKKVLERMQTSESMNESNWSKPKLDIEALKRAVIAAKQEEDEHSLPSKFFGDAIDFNASSHDFNATVSGVNIVLQDGFYLGDDQVLRAEAKHPIRWIADLHNRSFTESINKFMLRVSSSYAKEMDGDVLEWKVKSSKNYDGDLVRYVIGVSPYAIDTSEEYIDIVANQYAGKVHQR